MSDQGGSTFRRVGCAVSENMRKCTFVSTRVLAPFGIALGLALSPVLAGSAMPADDPLDDEAMVRAKHAGLSATDAAYRWFYPKYIHDYFKGMDEVVTLPDNTAYQLL